MVSYYHSMIDKVGGMDMAHRVRAELEELTDPRSMTPTQLFIEAAKVGWDELLYRLTLDEFEQLLNMEYVEPEPEEDPALKENVRLGLAILDFLTDHPWCYTAVIAQNIGQPKERALEVLELLKEQEMIKTVGEEDDKIRYAFA